MCGGCVCSLYLRESEKSNSGRKLTRVLCSRASESAVAERQLKGTYRLEGDHCASGVGERSTVVMGKCYSYARIG